MAIDIILNGEERQIEAGSTLEDLLLGIDLDPTASRGIAVAVNETIVRRPEWEEKELRAGDSIELVTALQGG